MTSIAKQFIIFHTDSACPFNPCANDGTCYPLGYGNNQKVLCTCPPNYWEDRCEEIRNSWEELWGNDKSIWEKGLFFFIHVKGASCSYNPCQNGGTCYRNGYGKQQELHRIFPTNYHGEQFEKVKKG